MRHTVNDETALPTPETEGGQWFYVRSLCEPRAYIHSRTGDVYFREDGQPWKHGGLKVACDRNGFVNRAIGATKEDHKVYPYASERAA